MLKRIILSISIVLLSIIFYGCPQDEYILGHKFSEDEEGLKDYLKNTRTVISADDSNNYEDLNLLTPDLENKSIFFTAEFHGFKSNIKLRMKFLKYFKHHTNFKYYLVELPYSVAHYLNSYLETGDTNVLNHVFTPLKGSFGWNKDNYNHWIELYEYNRQLNENDRIRVIGVDVEHQAYTAYRFMTDLLPVTEPPLEIKGTMDQLKEEFNGLSQLAYDYDKYKKLSQDIKSNIEEYTDLYKSYLGDNFFGFNLVNNNVINLVISKEKSGDSVTSWDSTRDKFIYENFKLVEALLPAGNFYGQWGMNHAFQSEHDKVMWFGAYLNSAGSKYKDKIFTVIFNYENCKYMKPQNDTYQEEDLFFVLPVLSDITSSFSDNYSLFKLNDTNARPDFKMVSFYTTYPVSSDVADFFQYVVLIKNSLSTEPLGEL